MNSKFWAGKKVLVTGHTGFKGAWASLWLGLAGANVTGVSLSATEPSLFRRLVDWPGLSHHEIDIRNQTALSRIVRDADPEIVLHLAAQALVKTGYDDPVGTFATNVMGTVQLLDALRLAPSVKAALIVTTDKVYEPTDQAGYLEGDRLGGNDPYAASKAAAEIATASWIRSFKPEGGPRIATARAGNVIGGGDWAADRLVPDIVRALNAGRSLGVRNPAAVRPWQFVLEPLRGYFAYAEALYNDQPGLPRALNFGPNPASFATVAEVIAAAHKAWGNDHGWIAEAGDFPPETKMLTLDSALAAKTLGWHPDLSLDEALAWTLDWYRADAQNNDMRGFSMRQIEAYAARAGSPL
jgi:CDP-glucose 4,6-dehydratase